MRASTDCSIALKIGQCRDIEIVGIHAEFGMGFDLIVEPQFPI